MIIFKFIIEKKYLMINLEVKFFRLTFALMRKLILGKSLTPKTLGRSMGGNMYNRPGWDIANNKQQLVAYLQQFLPQVITIGTLEDMTAFDAALYIITALKAADVATRLYPQVILADNLAGDELDAIKKLFGIE